MKIDFPNNLELENNKKIALEIALKGVCRYYKIGYDFSVTYRSLEEVIIIRITPKRARHYVGFHVADLNNIGEILNAEFKFCALYEGKLELTYRKQ